MIKIYLCEEAYKYNNNNSKADFQFLYTRVFLCPSFGLCVCFVILLFFLLKSCSRCDCMPSYILELHLFLPFFFPFCLDTPQYYSITFATKIDLFRMYLNTYFISWFLVVGIFYYIISPLKIYFYEGIRS